MQITNSHIASYVRLTDNKKFNYHHFVSDVWLPMRIICLMAFYQDNLDELEPERRFTHSLLLWPPKKIDFPTWIIKHQPSFITLTFLVCHELQLAPCRSPRFFTGSIYIFRTICSQYRQKRFFKFKKKVKIRIKTDAYKTLKKAQQSMRLLKYQTNKRIISKISTITCIVASRSFSTSL